jgi:hypothetical protein
MHKLLTNFLYGWAEKNDFGGITKLLREVPEHEMLELFKHAILWKDKGVRGKYHGEFVHFWQWFIVTEGNKDKAFLLVTPPDLLRWIGTQTDGDVIWDKTFEGSGGGPGPIALRKSLYRPDFDARNFDNLNTWMLSNECKLMFPTLHALMHHHSAKHRGFITDDTPTQTNTRLFRK